MQGQTLDITDQTNYQEVTFAADGTYSSTIDGTGTYNINGSAMSVTSTSNGVTQTIEGGATITQNGMQYQVISYTYLVEGDTLKMIMTTEVSTMGVSIVSISTVVYERK
jgi:hypothetical protein